MKELAEEEIRIFLEVIKENSNYNFNGYSISSLRRRLSKITEDFHVSLPELNQRLSGDAALLELIIKKITVNTTELFRDPAVWISLRDNILPRFKDRNELHIWHPGCSTGQEIFSMMMILDDLDMLDKAKIYGSDINSDVLSVARSGKYKYRFNSDYIKYFNMVFNPAGPDGQSEIKKPYGKYFRIDESRDLIQFSDFLRNKPVYKKIDLACDDNLFFVNFDLIICRNVIIYFTYELQNKVFDLFHRSLNEKGVLLLGLHESILGPYAGHFLKQDQFYFRKKI